MTDTLTISVRTDARACSVTIPADADVCEAFGACCAALVALGYQRESIDEAICAIADEAREETSG